MVPAARGSASVERANTEVREFMVAKLAAGRVAQRTYAVCRLEVKDYCILIVDVAAEKLFTFDASILNFSATRPYNQESGAIYLQNLRTKHHL